MEKDKNKVSDKDFLVVMNDVFKKYQEALKRLSNEDSNISEDNEEFQDER